MKRTFTIFLITLLLLSACGGPSEEIPETAEVTEAATEMPTEAPTVAPTETPTEAPTEAPTEPPTQPEHSLLYIPGVTVEDVILYFNEVCLDAEIITDGDASLLQKWVIPIRYRLVGEYTDEDLQTLTGFTDWLNTVEGFPGIAEAQDDSEINLWFHFCHQSDMPGLMGDWAVGLDGAVTFWYEDNEIYTETICCRRDVDQYLRNSVILEELYNGLGPVQDTLLRPDSLIYAEYTVPQTLTEIDELLLKLLYHPEMICGMDAAACEEVIRRLYY